MLNDGVFLIVLAAVLIALSFLLYRLVSCPTNQLEWTDLIATNGFLNAYKIGYWIGVGLGAWVIVKQTYMSNLDAGIFIGYLGFLAGVTVGNAAVRARAKSRVDNPDA